MPRWFFATTDGLLTGADLSTGERFFEARLPFAAIVGDRNPAWLAITMCPSDDGRILAVAQRRGLEGAVFDVASGKVVLELRRGDYHPEHCTFPLRFLDDHRLVHAVEWNQLALSDCRTLERLDPNPETTKLDYFFGALERSPNRQRLASTGWVWHPLGVVGAFDVQAWHTKGEPEPVWATQSEVWDLSCCWVDDERIATETLGMGEDVLLIQRPEDEQPLAKVPAPNSAELAMRRDELLSLGAETRAYDSTTLAERSVSPMPTTAWHPGTQEALSFTSPDGGGPWRLLSRPRSPWPVAEPLRSLARQVQASPSVEGRLVLADALEVAGHSGDALEHLKTHGAHERCFVVDDLAG
ncbi:MAG: hypothetical protein JNM69_22645 [Archangium sp.]|nr:hypothetical protein [Archangium sp.]